MRILLAVITIGIVVFLFGLINYYIGLRGWQGLIRYLPVNQKVYWTVFWIVAMSYLLGRLTGRILPGLSDVLTLVGSYWLASMLYFTMALVLVDLIRLIDKKLGFLPTTLKANPIYTGITVFILVGGLLVYGSWNALHPRVHHYDVTINKKAGNLKELHVVIVSDIHLGTIVGNDRLLKMVNMVNGLKPDIVLFSGDVIDESVGPFVEQRMAETLKKIDSRYGTYDVLGNHEYIGGNANEAIKYLQQAGVKVLKDKTVKVDDKFYLVGRDDRSGSRFNGKTRKNLSNLLDGIDRSLPILVMDHQPANLKEPELQGVDLQLSGHTHAGQLFPDRLVTGRIYEDDWGYLRKGNFQLIVSSGFGTWGPPLRIGNYPEVVDLEIHFTK